VTIVYNTAESGLSDGTAVTTGNSDDGAAGNAFTTVQGTWTFETDAAKSGSLGYQLALDGSARYLRGDEASPSGRGGMAAWFHWNGVNPGSVLWLGSVRDTADSTLANIGIYTNGSVRCTGSATVLTGAGAIASAVTLPGAGWYRYQILETPGGSTATGTVEMKVWDTTGTLVGSAYNSGATVTVGSTNPPARFRYAAATLPTGSTQTVLWLDNLAWGSLASGDIPDVENEPPTGSITANQNVAASAAVSATVSASDPDGTIASYAWSYVAASSTGSPTLSGASTATVSFTAGAVGNLYTLQCIVTDNGGETATFTTEVRVPTTSTTPVPLAINATEVGTWTITGGSSTDGAALADASDSTYLESPTATGTEATSRTRLQPMTVRSALTITERLALDSAGSVTVKVRLYEGSTQRQEWTVVPTTSIADYACVVTTPGAIVDWGNLWAERSIVSV
jgi:hypothetical protein